MAHKTITAVANPNAAKGRAHLFTPERYEDKSVERPRGRLVLFGDWIGRVRAERGMTQQQLADALEVSVSTVIAWEHGDVSKPQRAKLGKLASALNMDVATIDAVITEARRAYEDTVRHLEKLAAELQPEA